MQFVLESVQKPKKSDKQVKFNDEVQVKSINSNLPTTQTTQNLVINTVISRQNASDVSQEDVRM